MYDTLFEMNVTCSFQKQKQFKLKENTFKAYYSSRNILLTMSVKGMYIVIVQYILRHMKK